VVSTKEATSWRGKTMPAGENVPCTRQGGMGWSGKKDESRDDDNSFISDSWGGEKGGTENKEVKVCAV